MAIASSNTVLADNQCLFIMARRVRESSGTPAYLAYVRAPAQRAAESELELVNHDGPSSTFDVARDRIESGEERVGKIPAACWS